MKFKIKACNEDNEKDFWWEDYEDNITDPEKFGKDIVEYFNSTLRRYEKRRKYLGYRVIKTVTFKEHDWSKQNIHTLERGGNYYDKLKCQRCGITGIRYGLHKPKRDSKYKSNVYDRCDTTMKHLEALALRKARNATD